MLNSLVLDVKVVVLSGSIYLVSHGPVASVEALGLNCHWVSVASLSAHVCRAVGLVMTGALSCLRTDMGKWIDTHDVGVLSGACVGAALWLLGWIFFA